MRFGKSLVPKILVSSFVPSDVIPTIDLSKTFEVAVRGVSPLFFASSSDLKYLKYGVPIFKKS